MVKPSQYRLVNYPSVTETPRMKTDTPTVATRRRRLREWINTRHEGSQAAFVAATGINQGELSLLLKDKSFGEKKAAAIELAAGMPTGYLSGAEAAVQAVSLPAIQSDYVRVEQIDAEAQMGTVGRINEDFPEVIRAMDFAPTYIRSVVGFLPPPGRLKLVTGVGDSMSPKIKPGEMVLVDTGCTEFVGDGLYLINTGQGQQIKALQSQPDGIWARSYDPVLYPPFRLTDDSIIGGRVYLIQRLERVA